mgnify:CR=1 FL=1
MINSWHVQSVILLRTLLNSKSSLAAAVKNSYSCCDKFFWSTVENNFSKWIDFWGIHTEEVLYNSDKNIFRFWAILQMSWILCHFSLPGGAVASNFELKIFWFIPNFLWLFHLISVELTLFFPKNEISEHSKGI